MSKAIHTSVSSLKYTSASTCHYRHLWPLLLLCIVSAIYWMKWYGIWENSCLHSTSPQILKQDCVVEWRRQSWITFDFPIHDVRDTVTQKYKSAWTWKRHHFLLLEVDWVFSSWFQACGYTEGGFSLWFQGIGLCAAPDELSEICVRVPSRDRLSTKTGRRD